MAKLWRKRIAASVSFQTKLPPKLLTGDLIVTMRFYRPKSTHSNSPGDLDHLISTIFPLLEHRVCKNDKQFAEVRAKRAEHTTRHGVDIWITLKSKKRQHHQRHVPASVP